jgi:putative ABC transport system ATP-binding protein
MLVEAVAVVRTYATAQGPVPVLRGITMGVAAGEVLAITGASGSGKSTLLTLLAGLDRADGGSIRFNGQDLATMDEAAITAFRRDRLGFLFQSHRLLPALTALENVALPVELARRPGARDLALAWLERVGLSARAHHRPSQLSGGEQQRVALARALVHGPSLVCADEPTGSLDSATGAAVADRLFALVREAGAACVLVTHDATLAARADRRLALANGQVVGATSQVAGASGQVAGASRPVVA